MPPPSGRQRRPLQHLAHALRTRIRTARPSSRFSRSARSRRRFDCASSAARRASLPDRLLTHHVTLPRSEPLHIPKTDRPMPAVTKPQRPHHQRTPMKQPNPMCHTPLCLEHAGMLAPAGPSCGGRSKRTGVTLAPMLVLEHRRKAERTIPGFRLSVHQEPVDTMKAWPPSKDTSASHPRSSRYSSRSQTRATSLRSTPPGPTTSWSKRATAACRLGPGVAPGGAPMTS